MPLDLREVRLRKGRVRGTPEKSCPRRARERRRLTSEGDGKVSEGGLASRTKPTGDPALLTVGIGACLNRVEELHRAHVVDIDLLLENDDHALAVELDPEDGRWEEQLADDRLSLRPRQGWMESNKVVSQRALLRHSSIQLFKLA